MKPKTLLTTLIATLLFNSCGDNTRQNQQQDFISINIRDVSRRVEVPLSSLIESLEIIHLCDKYDEAFSNPGPHIITENFIGRHTGQDVMRLFDRATGRFIGKVGAWGQGPGEISSSIYHAQICEIAGRVYLVTWANIRQILTYDLQGRFLADEVIPLAFTAPKTRFFVDNENQRVVVFTLPFQGANDYVVWVQDFEGNVIQKISSEGFALPPDFSNEVAFSGNTPNFDFGIMDFWQGGQDTLFHYDIKNNVLRPVFTLEPRRPGELVFGYLELPRHFLVDIQTIGRPEVTPIAIMFSAVSDRTILVDKATREAKSVQIINDFLGNWVVENIAWFIRNGYFAQSFEPMELQDILEEALERRDLTPEVRERVIALNRTLHQDGNDVVLIGRLKQNPAGDFREVEHFSSNEAETETETEGVTIVVSDDEPILTDDIHTTAFLNNHLEYFRENNRFRDWDADDEKVVWVRAVINRDGTSSYVEIGRSSGIEKLDNEAIRLIQGASFTPARNAAGEFVRAGGHVFPVQFPPR